MSAINKHKIGEQKHRRKAFTATDPYYIKKPHFFNDTQRTDKQAEYLAKLAGVKITQIDDWVFTILNSTSRKAFSCLINRYTT